jgi:signal peptidase I
MGSADHQQHLTMIWTPRQPAHSQGVKPILPDRVAWLVVVVSTVCRSVLSTVVALLLWSIVPGLVGFQTTVVMSGSMAPALNVGDVVVVRSIGVSELHAGQVLLFDDPDQPGKLRMHRLAAMADDGLVTRGDANADVDSSKVGLSALHGAGFLRVPFAGLPEYWVKTHEEMPLVLGGLAVLVLLGGVRLDRLLENPDERRRRRHRGVRTGGLHRSTAALVVVVALSGAALAGQPSAAQATYRTSTSTNARWSFCGDRARDSALPTPRLAWGYAATSSGSTAVSDAAIVSGTTPIAGPDPGVTSALTSGGITAVTRQTTCTGTSSPYISLGPAKGTIMEAGGTSSRSATVTIASWFRTSTTNGVIAAFSDGIGVAAGVNVDRALYVNSDGKVAFSNLATLGLWTCTGSTTVTTTGTAWHLAVATWSATTGCKLWVDGSAAVTNAPTLGPIATPSAFPGRWRVGYERTAGLLGIGSADYAFVGDLDETRVWDSVLSDADVSKVLSRAR